MAFVLVRVDDRLIHGQVAVAWGAWLSPEHMILVNDEVACCDWKCALYADSDSMGVPVSVVTCEGFAEGLKAGEWDDVRTFLIVEDPRDLLAVIRGGLDVSEANIGGMHHAEGKRELLPYVFVDDADVAAMKAIMAGGTRLTARDVPQAQPQDLAVLLRALGEK
ncbi:MAG: PTS sugar transporter subunit IIB [Candidatus Eisenbacteria sp.]|nr:PTS sugar transporter subunit IIB [Candidatus Eisenbacteria bacterium]